jgi:hypothetical protein
MIVTTGKLSKEFLMRFCRLIFAGLILLSYAPDSGAQLPEIYTRYSDALQTLTDLQADFPEICKLDTMGYSTRDAIPMLRVKISDNVDIDEDEPAIFYCGGVHADEVLGAEVVMSFIQDILIRYDSGDRDVVRYINDLEIFCIPFINPEGHIVVEEGDTEWRKNKCDNDDNGIFDFHDGVDNNRNYDFGFWIDDGPNATTPESLTYKGEAPFTQTENIAMAEFGWTYRPLIALDYHSPTYGRPNVAYYPWYWYANEGGHGFGPDEDLMLSICQSFTSLIEAIPDDSGNGTYTARRALVNKGDYKTYFYGNFGSAAFSVEVSDTTIQDPALVDTIVTAHLPGQYYLLERALGAGITGIIRDSVTLEPIEAEVQVLQHINEDINPRLSRPDYGRYRRLLAAGSYTLKFIKEDYSTRTVYNVGVTNSGPTRVDMLLPPLYPRPPAPFLIYPLEDTTLDDNMVVFEWNPSDLADYYLFELYQHPDLETPIYVDSSLIDTSFSLDTPLSDSVYYWTVKGGNSNGWGPYSELWMFRVEVLTGTDDPAFQPGAFELYQNYPNPFNPATKIEYYLTRSADVTISVYNLLGQPVATLFDGSQEAGDHSVTWDASGFRSGVYFVRLEAGDYAENIKMVLLR